MDYEQQYNAAKVELAEMRQAFKDYMAAVADFEGSYFAGLLKGRSATIFETLLEEVKREDDIRWGRATPEGSGT